MQVASKFGFRVVSLSLLTGSCAIGAASFAGCVSAEPPAVVETDGGTGTDSQVGLPDSNQPDVQSPPPPESLEIYVRADTGADTNVGTAASPLKTIKKAIELWKKGKSIVLLPGIFSEVSGEVWPYNAPSGLLIKAAADGVILKNNTQSVDNRSRVALNIESVTLENIAFQNFDRALVQEGGRQVLTNVSFDGQVGSLASDLKRGSQAIWTGVNMRNAGLALTGSSSITLKKPVFKLNSTLFIEGASELTLEDGNVPIADGFRMTLKASSKAIVKNSKILGYVPFNITENSQLEVVNSEIIDPNQVSEPTILIDTSKFVMRGGRILSAQGTPVRCSQGTPCTIAIEGAILDGSYSAILAGAGSLDIKTSFLTAPDNVISSRYGATIKMRDSELITQGRNAIYIDTNGANINIPTVDLGTVASPGGNKFSGNPTPVLFAMPAANYPLLIQASGNTWLPNTQSADAAGKYATGVTVVGPSGAGMNNYYISARTTLQF